VPLKLVAETTPAKVALLSFAIVNAVAGVTLPSGVTLISYFQGADVSLIVPVLSAANCACQNNL